jgi:hypothetical protein
MSARDATYTEALARAADHARRWLASVGDRPVRPRESADALRSKFLEHLPEEAMPPEDVVAGGVHRAGPEARGVGARRRRLRPVGGGQPAAAPPGRRRGARRLLGDRRPQVAQRPLRLGDRRRRRHRRALRRDERHRLLPAAAPGWRARRSRLGAGVLAAGARLRRLRGAALAGPARRRRAGRALLRARPADGGGLGRRTGGGGAERSRSTRCWCASTTGPAAAPPTS